MNNAFEDVKSLRHYLHQHPELSFLETNTSEFIERYLADNYTPDHIYSHIGGTGIAAVYDSGKQGPVILLRAELDALPIQEINAFDHKSVTDNVSHKCGHDGHMATLIGAAQHFHQIRPSCGKVVLIFQPAEETGEGANSMISDPVFQEHIRPDCVFGFHNVPGYELGQIILRKGSFTASVRSMIIKLTGKTAHAAEPENGRNPSLAIARLLLRLNEMSNNSPAREDFRLITPVHVTVGEVAYGVSAGYGEVHLTIRTWTEEEMSSLAADIVNACNEQANQEGLACSVGYTECFAASENADACVDTVEVAAKTNQYSYFHSSYPMKWGEDFGLFTQKFNGCFFGIGAGKDHASLHNPDYDYPDEILSVGINMFLQIVKAITEAHNAENREKL
mmetsp:Transcript_20084/g.28864  ORF Transcript_20084/g.28864 Transcript_20084/m.28864 type:complete len:392 (+) Transcript_20084:68-1243(+)|eukprot:CAMPEP_0185031782 /NCGR_PEP_ID=MMETSP1103-20130426/19426_1 /TAXON_ID=36769 /ORGANISM="Paraphysomonas bandaiensis, Strain Caron Lab Isolate" /LENGTH=391 /DNA_ID=CAMNT_0027567421 /DNA_START=13 /DNA_END=1188 /DNA_ORIENTATION=-